MTDEEKQNQDVSLAKCWSKFKAAIERFTEEVDECTVDLRFESSIDEITHYSFDPDEPIFICDVKITPKNQVSFGTPYADRAKYFLYPEAELILTRAKDATVTPLNEVISQLFRESFAEFPECSSITVLERKYLLEDGDLANVLNNSDDYVRKHNLNIERKKLYDKLDSFGLF